MEMQTVIQNFQKHGFRAVSFPTKEEAAAYLNRKIDGVSVAYGGSVTVSQMGLLELLKTHNDVIGHWDIPAGMTKQEVYAKAAATDVYLTSANGASETGELVNIDGHGNRVSSALFGHKKVYFIVGVNKFEPTLEKAMWRARNVASPLNAKRLGRKTPCAVKGDRCYDCSSPERICNGFVIHARKMSSCEMEVVIVEEPLGF
ncbi:MAG: lactate utilization protein [Clostridia bacterium]|nr:lactate utilization protein [Clostridia bacterium]